MAQKTDEKEKDAPEKSEKQSEEKSQDKAEGKKEEGVDQDEFKSGDKTCPECDQPIDNLRKTCANCGYEYQDSDYDDEEAGNEFIAGSNMDDEGNEITEEGPGAEEGTE